MPIINQNHTINPCITDCKVAEEKEAFQSVLLNSVGQAVIMVDKDGVIRCWNKPAEKLYGFTKSEVIGRDLSVIYPVNEQEDLKEAFQKTSNGQTYSKETVVNHRNGSIFAVIVNSAPILRKNKFTGMITVLTDITSQKQIENDLTYALESLSQTIDKIQELHEKLRVVGGIALHDIRNKLSCISANAYLIKKRNANDVNIIEGISSIEQTLKNIVEIIDFAKMYEQLGAEELTYIDVEKAFNESVNLAPNVNLKIINNCRGLTVLADSFLWEMFYNFIDDTRKYGKKATTARLYYKEAGNDILHLIYEDDGVGIPLQNKPKLFTQGFTTGNSTGFALFLSKRMIELYGWQIQETGEPETGARFVITVPKLNSKGQINFKIQNNL